jgi:hypothetical protein
MLISGHKRVKDNMVYPYWMAHYYFAGAARVAHSCQPEHHRAIGCPVDFKFFLVLINFMYYLWGYFTEENTDSACRLFLTD